MRAQGALEYLIIIAAVLGISAITVMFITGVLTGSSGGADISGCRLAAANCQKDLTLGLSSTCPYCETACKDASGKDLIDKSTGACGPACQQCKQGKTISSSSTGFEGVVAYWQFDEKTGVFVPDSSPNRRNATYFGETFNDGTLVDGPNWVSGRDGYAIQTSGNARITITPLSIGNEWTIMAWFLMPLPAGPWQTLTRGSNDHQILVLTNVNLGTFDNLGGTGFHDCGWDINTLSTGWHHIAAVGKTDGNTYFYVDGQYKCVSNFRSTTDVYSIGNYQGGGQPWGTFDSVRIFGRALTEAEILAENDSSIPVVRPLGAWEFNEGYGTTTKENHIWVKGKAGNALSFNGINDYANASGFIELGTLNKPYSFEGWLKAAPGETDGNIVFMSSAISGVGWCLPPVALEGGKIRGYSWNSGPVSVYGTTTVTSGQWYHFVNTWDPTNGLRIYVNGNLEGTTSMLLYTASGASNYLWSAFSPLTCSGDKGWFNGVLDGIRVYNVSLSPPEVSALYNSLR